MLRAIFTLSALLASLAMKAQPEEPRSLGIGLTVFWRGFLAAAKQEPIVMYDDSLLTRAATIGIEATTCPSCMACAEPTSYYDGPVHPFLCGYQGMALITVAEGRQWRKVIIDTNNSQRYLRKNAGHFYSWRDWMVLQGRSNEYLMRDAYNKELALYDKPYDLKHLPVPDANNLVQINVKDIDEMHLIPVDVQGYWMKVRVVDYWKKNHGFAWLIWRTQTEWAFGFKWHAD